MADQLQRNADEARKKVERFCAEAAKLPPDLFGDRERDPRQPARDAAAFLAPLVDWKTRPVVLGRLHLPDPLTARIKAMGDDWVTRLTYADTKGFDFGWMEPLLQYDVWNLTSAGPLLDAPPGTDSGNYLPDYSLLVRWSKLRLTRSLVDGDVSSAAKQVHHVAVLMHSTGVAYGDFAAANALRAEAIALSAARDQGRLPPDVAVPDLQSLASFRILAEKGTGFFWPGVDAETMKRAFQCSPSPCAALINGAWVDANVGALAAHPTSDAFWSLARNSACDSGMLQLAREAPAMTADQASQLFFTGPSPLEELFR